MNELLYCLQPSRMPHRLWMKVDTAPIRCPQVPSTTAPSRPTACRRLCDATLRIDGAAGGAPALVDSLNVSVATGILLHQLLASAAQELT